MEAVADHGADVLLDKAEALDAHGAEHPEALALQTHPGGWTLTARRSPAGSWTPSPPWTSLWRAHLVKPLLSILLDGVQTKPLAAEADVAPGVAAEGPAGALEFLDDGPHRLPLGLAVGLQAQDGPQHTLSSRGQKAFDLLL